MHHNHYVVRNCFDEEIHIFQKGIKFIFVEKEYSMLPKPQSCSKFVDKRWHKDDESFHVSFPLTVEGMNLSPSWYLKDGYWYERTEIKPKAFKTLSRISVVKFCDLTISLEDAIGSCICQLDAYIDTYPEVYLLKSGKEIRLPRNGEIRQP